MRRIALIVAFLLGTPRVGAVPDQTMSITPSATAGATITAADENSRGNSASTPYNAHTHNDISQTANTLNLGDGTAGNKTLTANAADATDLSIRWNDTRDVFEIQQQVTTYNTVASYSSDPSTGGIMIGNGVGGMTSNAPTGDDQIFISDSASAETWRTLPNCPDTGGNHLNYTASSNLPSCGTSSGGVFTRAGGNLVEGTTTSTSTADVLAATGLNIANTSPFLVLAKIRKTAGAAATASVGISITQSGGTSQIVANFAWSTATNQAESGILMAWVGPISGGLSGSGVGMVTATTTGPTAASTDKPVDSGWFNAQNVTAITITGLVGNASVTLGVDELNIYALANS